MDSLATHHSGGVRRGGSALVLAVVVAVLAMAIAATASAASFGATGWGSNHAGQLGTGTEAGSGVPVAIAGLTGVTALSAGSPSDCGGSSCGGHTLALLSSGKVMAWGSNGHGQLGNGTTTGSDVPVAVSGLGGVAAIAAGGEASLALLNNGTVMAWGYNHRGELGNGTTEDSDVPVPVTKLNNAIGIAAGEAHSLAVLSNGTVVAWGSNNFGQLGDGGLGPEECAFNPCSKVPVAVSGLTGVAAVSAQANTSLARLTNGTVSSWGGGATLPSTVSGLTEVTALSAGSAHNLALLHNGTVMAWGQNFAGQLGDGSTENSASPVPVTGLTGVTAIAAGEAHSLALLEDGSVMAWGENGQGQLGDGMANSGPEICFYGFEAACSRTPVPVSGLSKVAGIAAGFTCSFALGEPFPGVSGLNPESGPAPGGTSVTITGINLTGATAVKFGPTNAASFTVNSATSITAVSPAGTGTVDVTVTTPAGTSAPGPGDHFTYGPTVTGVNPDSGPAAGGTTVTITGTTLGEATAVTFGSNSAASFTVNSATSVTAVAPAGTGTVDVTVTTPEGTSPLRTSDRFTYIPWPAVTNVSPSTGLEIGGTSVTIGGANLTGATAVKFGSNSAASFTVNSATSITAISPAGTGTVDVTVTTPGGTSATSPADTFTYVPFPPPAVTKVVPAKGPVAGGTSVTITGTNFAKASAVKFGPTSATSFTLNSSTKITAISPAEPAGKVDVTVTTPSGTSAISTHDHFSYSPAVTGLSPAAGATAGGTGVTVTGTGFALGTTATIVHFGTAKATSVNCATTTTCVVVAPAHAAGVVDVKVTVNKVASPRNRPGDQFTYS
jgi:alpha-tubulin suppressor-like RCC1 family protein